MEMEDKRKMYMIPQVDTEIGLWTVRVQVVEVHRSQVTSGKNGSKQKTFQRFMVVDEEGTPVSAVLYEGDIDYYSDYFQQFKRYKISNAKLSPAYAFFKVGPYEYYWIISRDTPVEPIEEPLPPQLPFTHNVCPFKDFMNHADKEIGFNIKGIVVRVFPRREVKTKCSQREVVLIDQSITPIILTLWNTYGDEEGDVIAANIEKHPVIIGVNMLATTFHGLSLGTRMYSCFLIDPPLRESERLKEWYASHESEINNLVEKGAYRNTDMLLPPPDLADTIDVPTALATLHSVNTAWVEGHIRFMPTQQPYYVCACSNCHKKADTGCDWYLHCSACHAYDEVELRCKIPVELEGNQKTIRIVLTTPDVERLTGLTAEKMKDAHQFDFNVDDDLLLALDRLKVVCFLKRYDRRTMGTPSGPGLRYSVVKTYAIEALKKATTVTTIGETSKQVANSAEEQNSATTRTDNDTPEVTIVNEAETPRQKAKRPLEFNAEEAEEEGNLPINKLATAKVVKKEPTSGESTSGKTKKKSK